MKKKAKATWGWVMEKQTSKPTDSQKATITTNFEPLVQKLKENLAPVPAPQEFNHCVDVFSKWRGSYFYMMQKYQCPPGRSYKEGFEAGIARLEFRGEDSFDLAYFRHTGQWFVVAEGQTLAACLKAVAEDPWFQVF